MAGGARPRPDAGRSRLLCLGLRRQARQHPGPRCSQLRRAAALDAGADRRRLRRADVQHRRRLRADHLGRGACSEVAAVRQGCGGGTPGRGMMPFAGGIEATANATLLFSLAAAVVYGLILNTRETLLRSAVKTLAVALLAALAAIQGGPLLLIAALALSALGDAFLSRDGDKAFLGGLASFLAAHLAYIALFWLAGAGLEPLSQPWRGALAVVMAAFAATMLFMLWRRVGPG